MHAHTPPFTLPDDAAARKALPLASGLLNYFPDALLAVAGLSFVANEQHNPGQHLHWDRSKSTDHDDCLMRHFMARGTIDTDKVRHRTKVAWRALAALQEEIERDYIAPVRADSTPAGSSRLASFGPNVAYINHTVTQAEIDNLRDLLSAEELKGFGIGDVPHTGHSGANVLPAEHSLRHAVLDERTPEDRL